MLEETTEESRAVEEGPKGYRVSNGPIVRLARSDSKPPAEFADAIELPRVYGAPFLFAIARDPRTLFVYWNIDWAAIFESTAPVDRQVHLRVYRTDGVEEMTEAVEPMAGNCYLSVSEPRETYQVEIGYYQPENSWNPVATSERTTMPPEQVIENLDVDVATIPFHLSFQRLIDLFRASNTDALSEIISRLQKRAVSEQDQALLRPEEWELLRAMDLSIEDMSTARRAFTARRNGAALRRRAETLLGFGATSPTNGGFGGSSWS